MAGFHIFIVEDDPWFGEILEYHLSLNPDYTITKFNTGKDCLANLHQKPDLVTLDYSLPDTTGEDVLKRLLEWDPHIPVVIISGQQDIAVAVQLLKNGAYDYLIKDDSTKDLLWNVVTKARETQGLREEVQQLRQELGRKYNFEATIIGQSPALTRSFQLMEKAARTNINVSITGETGTGKEVAAKAIHFNSDRKKKAFVPVNMAAIPSELVESELFGHEKGAFTGANARKIGKFEEAQGGTIFLDEIAELDLTLQSKLLRVLQEREVVRVGGNETIKLNVRLITATHRDLKEEVSQGRFREDLYYRIFGLPIELPPLRDRDKDVLLLAKHFLGLFSKENGMGKINLSMGARDKLLGYAFPGNVRELKAMMDLAAVMCEDNTIQAHDISYASSSKEDLFLTEEKSLRQYTCDIVSYFLKRHNNDVVKVAKKLEVGKSTIYKMIKDGEIIIQK